MKRKLKLLLTSGFEEILYTRSEPGSNPDKSQTGCWFGRPKKVYGTFFLHNGSNYLLQIEEKKIN